MSVDQQRSTIFFQEFEAKTGGRFDTLDITPEVLQVVRASGVVNGNVLVFSPHTTCCVLVASGGPSTRAAIEHLAEQIAPEDAYYAHDDLDIRTENLIEHELPNAPAHLAHIFIGKASECFPISGGELALEDEGRILFIELDSSRQRRYGVQVMGE
jgi:secondary thiamine-phosphate synthase enzyme